MSINALNARIEWLLTAFNECKLDNERQQRELADRDDQIWRLEMALDNRDDQIQRLESELAALKEQIRDPLDEHALSPPKIPVCIIQ